MKKLIPILVVLCFVASSAFAGGNDWTHTNNYNSNYNYNKDVAMAQTIAGFLLGAGALSKAGNGGPAAYSGQGYAGAVGEQGYGGASAGTRNEYYESQPSGYYQTHTHIQSGYQGVCQNYPVRDGYGRIIRVDTYCR